MNGRKETMNEIEKLEFELRAEELIYAQKMADTWISFERILRAMALENSIKLKVIRDKIALLDRRGK